MEAEALPHHCPFKRGIQEPCSPSRGISSTCITRSKGCRWCEWCFLSLYVGEGFRALVCSVRHLVVMLAVSALTWIAQALHMFSVFPFSLIFSYPVDFLGPSFLLLALAVPQLPLPSWPSPTPHAAHDTDVVQQKLRITCEMQMTLPGRRAKGKQMRVYSN